MLAIWWGIQSKVPYSTMSASARRCACGNGLQWCSHSWDPGLIIKDRVKSIIFSHYDIILLPYCPNNESPTLCQSASCAETGLLHCHPFKLQSRTKCENEHIVHQSTLVQLYCVFWSSRSTLWSIGATLTYSGFSLITVVTPKSGIVSTVSIPVSFIWIHSN